MRPARLVVGQALLTAAVLVTGIAVTLTHDSGPTAVPVASGPILRLVQRAPQALADAASLKMSMTFHVSANGHDATVRGQLTYDVHDKTGEGTIDIPGGGQLRLIQSRRTIYAPIKSDQALIYQGKHFVALAVSAGGRSTQLPTGDSLTYLQLLAGANGKGLRYGEETIDGVSTTHYQVTVDIAEALSRVPTELRTTSADQLSTLGISSLPMDVWLDRQGVPRQLRIKMNLQGSTADFLIQFSPSDTPVSVRIPAASDVYRVTDITQFMTIAAGQN
jgi:hypothetical protein